jgi:ribonuclease PH
MLGRNMIRTWPLSSQLAAVSAGLVQGEVLVDLTYKEDSAASVDLNLVLTETGRIVEIQAGAEGNPFTFDQLNKLLTGAAKGIKDLFAVQNAALEGVVSRAG